MAARREKWLVRILVFLVILSLGGCSKSSNSGKLETFYFFQQFRLKNYNDVLGEVLESDFYQLPENRLLPALISAYRQMRMLSVYQQLADTMATQLIRAYDEYRKLMEGNFYLFYKALLYLEIGERSRAVEALQQFLDKSGGDTAFGHLAQKTIALLTGHLPLEAYWAQFSRQSRLFPLTLSVCMADSQLWRQVKQIPAIRETAPPVAELLQGMEKEDGYRIWEAFQQLHISEPIYQEEISRSRDAREKLFKRFYNPAQYRLMFQVYRHLFHGLATEWLRRDLIQLSAQGDTTRADRLFYLNLELARSYQLGLADVSRNLFQILPALARTPFQRKLVQVYQEAFSYTQGKKEFGDPRLPEHYHPFMQALLDACRSKELSSVGIFFTEKTLEDIRRRLDRFARDEPVQEYALCYTGLTDLHLHRWKGAMIYLNYPVKKGFDILENDPLILTYLIWALWNEKSQMSECNWILSELNREFSYTEALYRWANEVIAAHHFK